MKLTERVKAAYKAFWGSGNWIDSSHRPGGFSRFAWTPGTNIDYASIVGPLWANSAVQACLNKITAAWPESYPCIKEKIDKKKVEIAEHPLTEILLDPNVADDDTVLWGGTIASFWTNGNAYWGINREKQTGYIGEFVYIPHGSIMPKRNEGSRSIGPDYYELYQDGRTEKHPVENIIHFRFGRDPYNDLLGMSPLASVVREVYTDNEAVNYINTSLKNRGAAWLIASPKEKDGFFNDANAVKDKIEAHTTGDSKGRALVMDGAVDIVFPPSVKDTGPRELRRTPEARISALCLVHPIWVGFEVGLDRSTFENTEQAERMSWNGMMSVQRMMGRQLTKQALRRPGNFAAKWQDKRYFAGFDYSEVRALQPNQVEERKSIGELHSVHKVITKDEAREKLGYDPLTPEQAKELEPEPEPTTMPAPKPGKSFEELREKIAIEASAREQEFRRILGMNPAEDERELSKFEIEYAATRNGH